MEMLGSYIARVDPSAWPGIMARRVHGLLYADSTGYAGTIKPGLTREGFTYDDLPAQAIRSGKWAPDLPGGGVERMPSHIVGADRIREISRFARAFSQHIIRNGGGHVVIPEPGQWNMKLPFNGYPEWRRDSKLSGPNLP